MSNKEEYIAISKSPQSILSIIQIVALLVTMVWIFAFMRADVNQNTSANDRQDEEIEQFKKRSADTYVRKDVFNEQYRQIMEKLNELDNKLDRQKP